ncbi:hypothetical protein BOO94_16485 [Pseudomonas sp. FSL W5-0299]|nr:hypothetical protein BOO94_16485 [Pseudomonas sp. FSL W5-0299]
MDHETFAGGHVIKQLAQQIEVGAVAFFVGLADVFGVPNQAPEHHPDAKQLRVHDPWRKRTDEKRVHFLRRGGGLLDFQAQGGSQFAGDLLVRVGNQRIDAAEMVIKQADGHPGFGGNTAHGNARMAVADQATQRGGHQHLATLIGLRATVFWRGGCHTKILGCSARLASLVEHAFNLQCRPQ